MNCRKQAPKQSPHFISDAIRRPPTQPREVCLDRRFIDENQPVRLRAHAGLTVRDPIMAGL